MSLDVYIVVVKPVKVFKANITHNLNMMAEKADLYLALWHPEQLMPPVTKARELIPYLRNGLDNLVENEAELLKYQPDNGWGTYDQLVTFVSSYLDACQNNPDGEIRVDT